MRPKIGKKIWDLQYSIRITSGLPTLFLVVAGMIVKSFQNHKTTFGLYDLVTWYSFHGMVFNIFVTSKSEKNKGCWFLNVFLARYIFSKQEKSRFSWKKNNRKRAGVLIL